MLHAHPARAGEGRPDLRRAARASPPGQVTAATLPGIDAHLWDWLLWLAAKQAAGKHDLVLAELAKLHEHLLGPLGVATAPATLGQAIAWYRAARDYQERRLRRQVPRTAEQAVSAAIR